MRRTNILWFDDDLRPKNEGQTVERIRLQPWLKWFNTAPTSEKFRLIEARELRDFSRILRERAFLQHNHPDKIDGILIDQMWREKAEVDHTFFHLDPIFSTEKVRHLDAGVQLIALLRNKTHADHRPDWISAYKSVPIAVFTTITEYSFAFDKYLDSDVTDSITGILKKVTITMVNGVAEPVPSNDITAWIDKARQEMLQRQG